jgi:hypothetical protein
MSKKNIVIAMIPIYREKKQSHNKSGWPLAVAKPVQAGRESVVP